MKNEPEIEKLRSREQCIFEKNRFYEIETRNNVNTVSDKRNWTGSLYDQFNVSDWYTV